MYLADKAQVDQRIYVGLSPRPRIPLSPRDAAGTKTEAKRLAKYDGESLSLAVRYSSIGAQLLIQHSNSECHEISISPPRRPLLSLRKHKHIGSLIQSDIG